jgi:methyltransferase family protein
MGSTNHEWSFPKGAFVDRAVISLDRYVARSMKTVQGYLTTLDARLIKALLFHQHENHLAGHLCEIGVHHGRLFLMLALARRVGERALAIDLFEDDALNANGPHAGRDRALFRNARRLGIELSEREILKKSSLDIEPADILERTTGLVRFFSVDGCHQYQNVEHDLRLAEWTLSGEGVIAVDDFFDRRWPDVSVATCVHLRRSNAVVPFAVTRKKLYLAPPDAAKNYTAMLRSRNGIAHFSPVQILGREVLAFREGALKRAYDFLRGEIARHSLEMTQILPSEMLQ